MNTNAPTTESDSAIRARTDAPAHQRALPATHLPVNPEFLAHVHGQDTEPVTAENEGLVETPKSVRESTSGSEVHLHTEVCEIATKSHRRLTHVLYSL